MLRVMKNKISGISSTKYLFLLFCAAFLLVAGIGNTFSYVMTKTPTLINRFLNGMNPDGDLVLQKIVSYPYGDLYAVPSDLVFAFEVNLSTEYANQTIETTQGEKTANENGIVTVTVAPGCRTTVYDIDAGTEVTVEEIQNRRGFTPDTVSQTLTIGKYQDNIMTFVNTYSPEKADTSGLAVVGTKTLAGRDWKVGDCFTFALEIYENGTWNCLGTQTIVYEPVANEIPEDFNKINFTDLIRGCSFDKEGMYSFRIREREGTIGGIAYDKAESRFDIQVGDADMDGYLEIQSVTAISANTAVEGMTVNVTFENKYAPAGSAEAVLMIQKILEDTSEQSRPPAGFTFKLYDEAGELLVTSEPTDFTGQTSIRLVYQPEDAGKVFNYTIKENRGGETVDALTYDDTVYQLQVAVRDNLDGTVSAYIYDTQADGNVVCGSRLAAGGSGFGFAAGSSVSGGDVSDGDASAAVSGGDAGDIPGGSATVSGGDAGAVSGLSGVTLPKGATNTYQAVFTNKYDPQDAFVTIKGTKILNGRALNAGEFTFLLYQTDALFTVPEGAQAVSTVVNDADGTFCFEEMCFTQVGDYYYVVAEDATGALGGVAYDSSRYLVTLKVRDYNGKLGASVSTTNVYGEASDIVFVNSYQPAPVSLPIIGRKILNGAELTEGAFRFDLSVADENYAAQGEAFQTVSNQGDGTIAFVDLTFTAAGTYRYVVTEQQGTVEGMTYDDTVYCVMVDVADPGDGQLVIDRVDITAEGQEVSEILFENRYVEPGTSQEPDEPSEPEEPSEPDEPDDPDGPDIPSGSDTSDESVTKPPKTGDDSNIWISIVVAVLSAGAVFLLLVVRRRRKIEN